jgi:hypothetical protein
MEEAADGMLVLLTVDWVTNVTSIINLRIEMKGPRTSRSLSLEKERPQIG